MKDQIIITMGREHGSGGHYIADMIARELGIKLYDKDSIESEIVSEGYSEELIRRMDEKPVNFFASRRIGRFSNSLEVNVAEKTFDMIRAKAASGESFLLIGRCGEQVLKDDPHRVSLFIGGDPHAKLCRVMEKKGLSAEEAIEEIRTAAPTAQSRQRLSSENAPNPWNRMLSAAPAAQAAKQSAGRPNVSPSPKGSRAP